jgi:hypothetical protein
MGKPFDILCTHSPQSFRHCPITLPNHVSEDYLVLNIHPLTPPPPHTHTQCAEFAVHQTQILDVDPSQSSPAWDPWGPRRDNGLTGPPASSAASGPARPGSPLWWGASVGPASSAALLSTPPPPEPLGIPASPSNRPTYNGILGSLSMNSPILQVSRRPRSGSSQCLHGCRTTLCGSRRSSGGICCRCCCCCCVGGLLVVILAVVIARWLLNVDPFAIMCEHAFRTNLSRAAVYNMISMMPPQQGPALISLHRVPQTRYGQNRQSHISLLDSHRWIPTL